MKHRWLLAAFLFSCALSIGAQTAVPSSAYQRADAALAAPDTLSSFLAESTSRSWYPGLESYVLKKARQMVIEDRLEQAQTVTLAVIDNNFDNVEAVDLYQSIQKSMARKKQQETQAAEKEALDTFRQQAAQAKIKQDVAKTYQSVTNKTSGKTIYLDQSFNQHYRTWNWDFLLELVNANMDMTMPGETAYKYGLGLAGSAVRHGETVTLGLEADASSSFVTLAGSPSVDWTAGAVGFIGSTNLHFALRAGFRQLSYSLGNPDLESLSFPTPVAGFALRDVPFGEGNRFRWSVDWYAGHLYTPGITAAGATDMVFSFRMADLQDFDIHFYAGIHDTLVVKSADIRNDARLSLAIGVGDYE